VLSPLTLSPLALSPLALIVAVARNHTPRRDGRHHLCPPIRWSIATDYWELVHTWPRACSFTEGESARGDESSCPPSPPGLGAPGLEAAGKTDGDVTLVRATGREQCADKAPTKLRIRLTLAFHPGAVGRLVGRRPL
jgi:hypothetical protein